MYRVTRLLENLDSSTSVSKDFSTQHFVQLLASHKALLFQNEESDAAMDVEAFGSFVKRLNLTSYPYVGGAAPRTMIPVEAGNDIVYTANEAPPDAVIPFHHELAQVQSPPKYLFFFCDVECTQGGETALIDSTLVFRYVNETFPEFMAKLKEHGARYVRTIPAEDDQTSPIGRSYFNTYQVKTKEELIEKLDNIDDLRYEWQEDGSIRITSEPIPAIKMISEYQNNSVFQYTFHNSVIAAFVGWEDSRNDRTQAVKFGNDESMPQDVLNSIAAFMEQHKVSYKWKKGDIFALDNRLVMHSRNSFTGPRKVYASMWGDAVDSIPVINPSKVHTNVTIGEAANQTAIGCISDPLTFGFWRLNDPENVAYNAIKEGYRRLDSACDYGNETQTGKGIQRALQEKICSREDLFVTSKLWNTYHEPAQVPIACQRTLDDLGLEYLDEYLIHFPISLKFVSYEEKYPPEWTDSDGNMCIVANDINATWKAMEELVKAGKVKSIGVSNFNCQHIRQVLSTCTIRPSTLQIEVHPHNSQQKLIRFAREAGLRVTVFSPLGGTSYIELDMATEEDLLMHDTRVKKIAQKYNKTPVQIMLRWAVQRNTMPISKSNSPARMRENRDIFDFYLHKEDVQILDSLNKNRRYNDPGVFCELAFGTFMPIYE